MEVLLGCRSQGGQGGHLKILELESASRTGHFLQVYVQSHLDRKRSIGTEGRVHGRKKCQEGEQAGWRREGWIQAGNPGLDRECQWPARLLSRVKQETGALERLRAHGARWLGDGLVRNTRGSIHDRSVLCLEGMN